MYVLVNCDKMVFAYKHANNSALGNLAHIEIAHSAVAIFPVDHLGSYARFTDLELKFLHRNTAGVDHIGFSRDHLLQAVMQLGMALPESVFNAFEVEVQARKISMADQGFYRYVKGSSSPARLQELFEPEPLALQPGTPLPVAPVLPASVQAAVTVQAKPIGAPSGGNRAVIWSVADKLWEDAGKPVDVKTVLALRKQMMSTLESDHNIKRTTSSTALGGWQKSRIPV
jgi:hypothetical protein